MVALLAPMIVGTLGQKYNFHLCFGVAAVGMFVGLVTYVLTKKKYMGTIGNTAPNPLNPEEKKRTFSLFGLGALVIIILGTFAIISGILTLYIFIIFISMFYFVLLIFLFV